MSFSALLQGAHNTLVHVIEGLQEPGVLAALAWQSGTIAIIAVIARLVGPRLRLLLDQKLVAKLHSGPAHLLRPLVTVMPWLVFAALLIAARLGFERNDQSYVLLRLAVSLVLAWVVIRLVSGLVRDARIANLVALLAWVVAALNIAGLLHPTLALLDAMSITLGSLRLSVLLLGKAVLLLMVLLWAANLLSRLLEQRLTRFEEISPAMQVLAAKLTRATLLVLAVVLSLASVGIDLTAFAVFSGAIGVGVGFGLQKVVSNLISGVILLLDASIKPGDVIQIGDGFGLIRRLNARYVSVDTRDGKEHLIPNEDLITQRVINWTYSDDRILIRVPFGVAYGSDLREVIALAVGAAASVARVLTDPKPICVATDFGDSAINFSLRFWIKDPRLGTLVAKSDVMVALWSRLQAAGITLPFPQRDLTITAPLPVSVVRDDAP